MTRPREDSGAEKDRSEERSSPQQLDRNPGESEPVRDDTPVCNCIHFLVTIRPEPKIPTDDFQIEVLPLSKGYTYPEPSVTYYRQHGSRMAFTLRIYIHPEQPSPRK
jgi:hypothetical protein